MTRYHGIEKITQAQAHDARRAKTSQSEVSEHLRASGWSGLERRAVKNGRAIRARVRNA